MGILIRIKKTSLLILASCTIAMLLLPTLPPARAEVVEDYSLLPPFITSGVPPLLMLVLGRDHKLYYEAYNDTSDLDGDGTLDVGFKPAIDYYGYFDSYKCYEYDTVNSRFNPSATTTNKKCTGANEWSGDFLNYLSMSRMDCLRKVLYGGYRATDTNALTILQRVYVPEDAHSWGKEYLSVDHDGYDISEYTPLALPDEGLRHLFASTTLSDNGTPILRVLPNNTHRIWNWVSIERPVAGTECVNTTTGSRENCEVTGGHYTDQASNHTEFNDMITRFAVPSHLMAGPTSVSSINKGTDYGDYYLHIYRGNLLVTKAGTYNLAVDGDDAVEVIVDGTVVVGWYEGHGKCNCHDHTGSISLTAGSHTIEFRHEEQTGNDNCYLWWQGRDSSNNWEIVPSSHFSSLQHWYYDLSLPSSRITDYAVRVSVCNASMLESNCKTYSAGTNKPVGILQRNGESDRMYFGLLTGSYGKNTSGGVLRKNIGSITNELSSTTGRYRDDSGNYLADGIIKTIDRLRIVGYDYGSWSYNQNCGWIATSPITEGQCRMWGNPIGEMMYESMRYFAGSDSDTPTSAFTYTTSTDDDLLGLPHPAWTNPYTTFSHCAKPFMLVLSDITPSFDSDQMPGTDSAFGTFSSSTLGTSPDTFSAATLSDFITTKESFSGRYFIGQSQSNTPNFDSSCTPKTVTGFGNIRGLCPEEPTKQGSYYSAAVAYFGHKTDLSSAEGSQNVTTYAVGLASPLPRIKIPVRGKTITLVPFAKSVGGYSISAAKGSFQPTNQIVDFYVETITPTYGRFRINYEDVEQGADHDMDAIVFYEYQVNADGTVSVTLTSEYAAGSIMQHMGYIISGTTKDGTYLEVRDLDTAAGSDPDYFLDTPPGCDPGGTCWQDSTALPFASSRTFSPGTSGAAALIENPLWYAAKWGGFENSNGNDATSGNPIPDLNSEWDKDNDGVPDTYFYVTNPLKLEEQLNKSFADILRRSSSGTAASVISSSRSGEGAIYQAVFFPEYKDTDGNTVNWAGEVHALLVDAYGQMREDTNGNGKLDVPPNAMSPGDYFIEFSSQSPGTIYKYKDTNFNGILDDAEKTTPIVIGTMRPCRSDETDPDSRQCLAYLWSTSKWLNSITNDDAILQRTYTTDTHKRYLFTFLDQNQNMVPDSGEIVPFTQDQTSINPFIHTFPPFELPAYLSSVDNATLTDFITNRSKAVINYIRGKDADTYSYGITGVPPLRSRQADYDEDGTVETWRLGDVVHSTATVVAAPFEDLDFIYEDASYTPFFRKYRNRRTTIYTGGNDGILHALNGGFYDRSKSQFFKAYDTANWTFNNDSGLELGAELWGYVPYNLLPHLYWLTEATYTADTHVAYVDLKPRVFDAKIFTPDTAHPNGWGTVMVCGMGFGGGKIRADMNKDGVYTEPEDRTMTSAFIVMDVTDPEQSPVLLGEISSNEMGFSTAYPTVFPVKDKNSALPINKWYLVLGSGPHDNFVPGAADGTVYKALKDATSDQPAKIFLVDLGKLAQEKTVSTVTDTGAIETGLHAFTSLDSNAFVSDPIAIDYNLDYKPDIVYFGTVSGSFDEKKWGGKLRRLVIANSTEPATWAEADNRDSTLIDLTSVFTAVDCDNATKTINYGQPIVAAPNVGVDNNRNRWVFFGTGRFFNRLDATNCNTAPQIQSYYGIKEPYDIDNDTKKVFTWETVDRLDLLDVTDAKVFDGGNTVQGSGIIDIDGNGSIDFTDLQATMNTKSGWLLDFTEPKERNLGQAALLGGILAFTSYTPSVDICEFEGNSALYTLYYTTGTAYKKSVIGLSDTSTVTESGEDGNPVVKHEVLKKTELGLGLAATPSLGVGRGDTITAFVQDSTGSTERKTFTAPEVFKSGKTSWDEWNETD